VQFFRPRLPPEAINFLTVHTNDVAQIAVPPENRAEHVVKFVERHLIGNRDQADDHRAHLAQYRSQNQAFEGGCFNRLSRLLGSPDPRLFGALGEPDLTRTTERSGMMGGVDTADDPWILAPGDHALVMSKRGRTRLGFAILLAFFRDRGRLPRHESEVDPQGIATLSQQLNVRAPVDGEAFLAGRTAERMHSEIRVRFGFREATVADSDALSEWLRDHAAAEAAGDDAGPHPLRAPTTCYPSVNWRLQAPSTLWRLLATTLYAGRYS
jgi:hypothetical protein